MQNIKKEIIQEVILPSGYYIDYAGLTRPTAIV
jgi:Cu/Ag efflux pump CusA